MAKLDSYWRTVRNMSFVISKINKRRGRAKINPFSFDNKFVLSQNKSLDENIFSIRRYLTNEYLSDLFIVAIEDMYKFNFKDFSSVETDFEMPEGVEQNDFAIYAKVNLMDHTFGVVNEMLTIAEKSYNTFLDYYILAALLHDFGKSPKLKKHYNLSLGVKHHKASAQYLDNLLILMRKKRNDVPKSEFKRLEIVADALRVHHDPQDIAPVPSDNGDFKDDKIKKLADDFAFRKQILDFLDEADGKQRNKEKMKAKNE